MQDLDSRLLLAISAENDRVQAFPRCWVKSETPQERAARNRAIRLIDEFGVRVQSDWLGSAPSQRKALFRSLSHIEAAGLVEVFAAGRVRFVKLSVSGWEAVELQKKENATNE
ncbi:MAG: hypothetical protein ACKVT0_21475 [Planctomycetaceae bacterium]